MGDRQLDQLRTALRALEIIADCAPPPPQSPGDVPGHHFYKLKALAARALRDVASLHGFYQHLETEQWLLGLPYDSVRLIEAQPSPDPDDAYSRAMDAGASDLFAGDEGVA